MTRVPSKRMVECVMHEGTPSEGPTDAALVRQALMRELETVSFYESLAEKTLSPLAKSTFLRSAKDEREHVAELMTLLCTLDAAQGAVLQKGAGVASAAGLSEAVVDPHKALRALPAPPSPHAFPLTVGALRGKIP